MNPRIIKVAGIWHCAIKGVNNRYVGLGFTPWEAYQDWVWHE